MTALADEKEAEKEAAKKAREARTEAMEAEEIRLNTGRTGKGTRLMVTLTRGRNPVQVVYEGFDESKPETLPTTVSEFMDFTKLDSDALLLPVLIPGYNSLQAQLASDPIAEHVAAYWPDDVQARFRITVRNYSKDCNVSIEDAIALIRPGIDAANPPKA